MIEKVEEIAARPTPMHQISEIMADLPSADVSGPKNCEIYYIQFGITKNNKTIFTNCYYAYHSIYNSEIRILTVYLIYIRTKSDLAGKWVFLTNSHN